MKSFKNFFAYLEYSGQFDRSGGPYLSCYVLSVYQVAKTVAQRLNTDPMLLQFFKSQG